MLSVYPSYFPMSQFQASLAGVILGTVSGSDGNAALGTVAWTAVSLSFRCLVYAVFTCNWNSAFSAACTCLGIRENISSINVGERDVIVMIDVYWYSRILLSGFMILASVCWICRKTFLGLLLVYWFARHGSSGDGCTAQ
jgi:hypothetical protein